MEERKDAAVRLVFTEKELVIDHLFLKPGSCAVIPFSLPVGEAFLEKTNASLLCRLGDALYVTEYQDSCLIEQVDKRSRRRSDFPAGQRKSRRNNTGNRSFTNKVKASVFLPGKHFVPEKFPAADELSGDMRRRQAGYPGNEANTRRLTLGKMKYIVYRLVSVVYWWGRLNLLNWLELG